MQRRDGPDLTPLIAKTPEREQYISLIIDKVLANITEEEKTAIPNKYVAVRYGGGGHCA